MLSVSKKKKQGCSGSSFSNEELNLKLFIHAKHLDEVNSLLSKGVKVCADLSDNGSFSREIAGKNILNWSFNQREMGLAHLLLVNRKLLAEGVINNLTYELAQHAAEDGFPYLLDMLTDADAGYQKWQNACAKAKAEQEARERELYPHQFIQLNELQFDNSEQSAEIDALNNEIKTLHELALSYINTPWSINPEAGKQLFNLLIAAKKTFNTAPTKEDYLNKEIGGTTIKKSTPKSLSVQALGLANQLGKGFWSVWNTIAQEAEDNTRLEQEKLAQDVSLQ